MKRKFSKPVIYSFLSILVLSVAVTVVPVGAEGMSGTKSEMKKDRPEMMDSDTMMGESDSMMAATVQMMDNSNEMVEEKPTMDGSDGMRDSGGKAMQ